MLLLALLAAAPIRLTVDGVVEVDGVVIDGGASLARRPTYTFRSGKAKLEIGQLNDALGVIVYATDGGLSADVSAPAPATLELRREPGEPVAHYRLSNRTATRYAFLVRTIAFSAHQPDGGWGQQQVSGCRIRPPRLDSTSRLDLGQWDEACLVDAVDGGTVRSTVFVMPEAQRGPVRRIFKVWTDFTMPVTGKTRLFPARQVQLSDGGNACRCGSPVRLAPDEVRESIPLGDFPEKPLGDFPVMPEES